MAFAIEVQGLNKSFDGQRVVEDFTLQVKPGEIFGFLGPNGSGKTTSIRMLCGLLAPDSGEGRCLGWDLRRQSPMIKRQTGYMTQRFSLWEDLTLRENLDFVARMYGMSDRRRVVAEALAGLGLTARRDQLAGTLSGGWKQRLALAACLLHQPRLLLLDEPTAGVDPKARRDFWEEIHRIAATGVTILVSTHYMDEAERCHRLAYLAFGRMAAQGTVGEIIAAQGLTTWEVSGGDGGDAYALAAQLEGLPGVEIVTPFGTALHVSGQDEARLEATLAPWREDPTRRWRRMEPSLEDAFIFLMRRAEARLAGGGSS